MTTPFVVTPESIMEIAQYTSTTADTIELELASTWQYIASLASEWSGMAHLSFTDVMLRWNNDSNSLNEALRGIYQAVLTVYSNYTGTEAVNLNAMTNVGLSLPPGRFA